jgi:hypothetical protein
VKLIITHYRIWIYRYNIKVKVKGKVHPRTGHKGLGGRGWRYSSTISLTSALDWWGWVVNAMPGPLYPENRDAAHIVQTKMKYLRWRYNHHDNQTKHDMADGNWRTCLLLSSQRINSEPTILADRFTASTRRSLQETTWNFLSKGKAVPLQAWSGLEGSRKLRFPDFMTMAQDGGKVGGLTHWPPLLPGNTPGTHFC